MRPKSPAVKRPRRYDATSRRARAQQTQAAIVAAAQRLFVRDGFQATTIPAVAAEAGVSQETIYKTFGGKTGLVRAIRERALAGEGPAHAERRSNALQNEERDPRRIIEGWGRLTMEVAPRVMPILQLVAAGAATDAEMARLRQELDQRPADADARQRRPARAAPATCARTCGPAKPPTSCGRAAHPNCTTCSSAAAAGRSRATPASSST